MSMSILYHAFGIKGVTYRSTYYLGNAVFFRVETTDHHVLCPKCGHRLCIFRGRKTRWLRMPPIGRKQAILELNMHRLQCKKCIHLWWPQFPFMQGMARYTRFFALTVLDLLRSWTIRAVAQYLHVSWDVVKKIHKSRLSTKYRKINLKDVKYIGVDEFSIRKHHKYMTIFIDLQTGRVLHAVEGTKKENLAPFLKTLSRRKKQLKAVAMDMSASFAAALKEYLPDVSVVFDRYHVMALMNRKIDSLRREQQRTLDAEGKRNLKGSRFLLLRNYHSLSEKYQTKLNTLLDANQTLFTMHLMKEQLRLFWRQGTRDRADKFFKQWCFDALMSGIKQLISVGITILRRRSSLLNYYPHRITNGPLEGLNNKIKTLKRQAYGFRDMEYFKLRLYDLHTSKYAFTG
ncbi:MAG: ISL3 family transposase [Deltaproteobacteria bacterium]|nr:ISL3 family transposase [Deltaproteobacteria bacterium]